jgi:hypothetical protein
VKLTDCQRKRQKRQIVGVDVTGQLNRLFMHTPAELDRDLTSNDFNMS